MMLGPQVLEKQHALAEFDSGAPALDNWLQHHAWAAHRSDSTRVYVVHEDNRVLGFYALSAGGVRPERAPARISKGQARYDIPLVVLTRLAIDRGVQGQGLGAALLEDALLRVHQAADVVGVRALHAHAKDARAKQFYEHFGFGASPVDVNGMYILLKNVRAILQRA